MKLWAKYTGCIFIFFASLIVEFGGHICMTIAMTGLQAGFVSTRGQGKPAAYSAINQLDIPPTFIINSYYCFWQGGHPRAKWPEGSRVLIKHIVGWLKGDARIRDWTRIFRQVPIHFRKCCNTFNLACSYKY